MDQLFQLFGVLAGIFASLSALYILSWVIFCEVYFFRILAKSIEPEPWERLMDHILHILDFIQMVLKLLVGAFAGVSLVLLALILIFFGYCYLHIFIVEKILGRKL